MDKNVAQWPTTNVIGLHALAIQVKPNETGELPESFNRALEDATYLSIERTKEFYRVAGVDFSPATGGSVLPLFENVSEQEDLYFHIANRERDYWQVLVFCLRAGANERLRDRFLACAYPHELLREIRNAPVPFLLTESVPGLAA